jgi:hypothetical protein
MSGVSDLDPILNLSTERFSVAPKGFHETIVFYFYCRRHRPVVCSHDCVLLHCAHGTGGPNRGPQGRSESFVPFPELFSVWKFSVPCSQLSMRRTLRV